MTLKKIIRVIERYSLFMRVQLEGTTGFNFELTEAHASFKKSYANFRNTICCISNV